MFEAPSILFAAAGAAVFVAAILPKVLRNAPFSMPMVFLGAGMAAFSLIPDSLTRIRSRTTALPSIWQRSASSFRSWVRDWPWTGR